MMLCCGSDRSTRYCPDCGKKLRGIPNMDEIIDYFTRKVMMANKRIESFSKHPEWYPSKEKYLARAHGDLEKYTRWVTALKDAIAKLDNMDAGGG